MWFVGRTQKAVEPLPTIWRVNDELWAIIQLILEELDPPAKTGRPRTGQREALDGIIYVMRTGGQWNQLPRKFGDDSSVHRTMQRWIPVSTRDAVCIPFPASVFCHARLSTSLTYLFWPNVNAVAKSAPTAAVPRLSERGR